MEFPRKYLVDDENKQVAVQLDIDVFRMIENALKSNHGIVNFIKGQQPEEDHLKIETLQRYFETLKNQVEA